MSINRLHLGEIGSSCYTFLFRGSIHYKVAGCNIFRKIVIHACSLSFIVEVGPNNIDVVDLFKRRDVDGYDHTPIMGFLWLRRL